MLKQPHAANEIRSRASISVESALRLASKPPSIDIVDQQGGRSVFAVAELGMQDIHDGEALHAVISISIDIDDDGGGDGNGDVWCTSKDSNNAMLRKLDKAAMTLVPQSQEWRQPSAGHTSGGGLRCPVR